eukprot:scaffold12551_cov21-Tisochrysis_lutea.AAC.1
MHPQAYECARWPGGCVVYDQVCITDKRCKPARLCGLWLCMAPLARGLQRDRQASPTFSAFLTVRTPSHFLRVCACALRLRTTRWHPGSTLLIRVDRP